MCCVEQKAGLELWNQKVVLVIRSISFHGKNSSNFCYQIFGTYLEQSWYSNSLLYSVLNCFHLLVCLGNFHVIDRSFIIIDLIDQTAVFQHFKTCFALVDVCIKCPVVFRVPWL